MMNRLASGVALLLAALAAAPIARAASRALVAEPVQGEKIRIDGDLREWPAKMTSLEARDGAALEARAVVGYDDGNLYLALRVADKRIARTAAGKDAEDHATLTLSFPRGRGEYSTYEVEIYPGNPGKLPALIKVGNKAVPGAKAVENLTEKELFLEAQIPWTTFPEAAKTRVGLRAAVTYTNADNPGTVKSTVSTSSGKSGKGLGPLLLEAEQGLLDLLRDKGLSDVPAREAYGNLSGDGMLERIAIFGPYVTISGPRFRGGKEFYFAELGVSGAEMVTLLKLADFDGDGHQELVMRKRYGTADKYREVLEVTKVGRDDSPFVAFSHEVGIKTADGSISNKVKIEDGGIEIAQGESEGFEPDTYNEPLPGGNVASALLPWESVASRAFKWQGNTFVKGSEEAQSSKSKGSAAKKAARAKPSDQGPAEPPAPRPPSADELLDRLYALYKKERGVSGGRPRFDFVTDVAGDSGPERVLIHDKDIVVFGKGFRAGTSYSFITVGVGDPKDILDATARDLTGDGKAEVVVRAVMRAKASKALGGDTIDRHALLVYGIKDERLVRVFAAETGRSLGKNQILGTVAFERASRGMRIELRPGRAIGWTESSYPFPPDTTTAGGLEPLPLPWSSGKRSYHWNGSAYVLE
jgi:hypothetical protein